MDGSTFNDRTCHYTLPRPAGRAGSCHRCHQMGHRVYECAATICGTCYNDHSTLSCPITHPEAVAPPAWQIPAAGPDPGDKQKRPARGKSARPRPRSTVRILYDPTKTTTIRLSALPSGDTDSDEDNL
jgi:hypothetical protein